MEIQITKPTTITLCLTLSLREARVLKSIMGAIGGPPDGPRKVSTEIYKALDAKGIQAPMNSGSPNLTASWADYLK